MGSLLIEEWLQAGGERIPILDEASVSLVRESVRVNAGPAGLSADDAARLVGAASELAYNHLRHAREGAVQVRPFVSPNGAGLEVIAADAGNGLVDPASALAGRPPAGGQSLGVGLAAVLELADEVDVDVRIGEGTCVRARKFREPSGRRRQVGVYGRPCPGEDVSGDSATVVLDEHGWAVSVVDGLGHGPGARDASDRAMAVCRRNPDRPPLEILMECHAALRSTRGAVMATGRIDAKGEATIGSVGNVAVHLYGGDRTRRIAGSAFVLGAPGDLRRLTIEQYPLAPRGALVIFTDGLSARADIEGDFDLLREHPVVIAQRIVERFSRGNDDALALVVT